MFHLPVMRKRWGRFYRAFCLVCRGSGLGLWTLGALTVYGAVSPVVLAWVAKLIVDAVVAAQSCADSLARQPLWRLAASYVLLEFAIYTAGGAVDRICGVMMNLVSARVRNRLCLSVLEKAVLLELEWFETPGFYDKLSRAMRTASSDSWSFVRHAFSFGRSFVGVVAYAYVLVQCSWALLFILVGASIPTLLAELIIHRRGFEMQAKRAPINREIAYIEHVAATDTFAKDVRMLGLGSMLSCMHRSQSEKFVEEDRAFGVKMAVWSSAWQLCAAIGYYGCFAYVVWSGVMGDITLGDMTMYSISLRQSQGSLQSMLATIREMYAGNLNLAELSTFLELPHGPARPAMRRSTRQKVPGIVFQNVGYRYVNSSVWAVRGISLAIQPGERIALVGENGAGKSTLLKLLCRLYRPTEGTIYWDGKDLNEFTDEEIRSAITVVWQDYAKFQFSAMTNVGIGDISRGDSEKNVLDALDIAGARDLVERLPLGLATRLGHWFEGGVEISGGEWQKIVLARACMRSSAKMMIWDEPTSFLDAAAEEYMFRQVQRLSSGRTAVLVSHRLGCVQWAEQIVVMEKGAVREVGTHRDLYERGGKYAELFEIQAKHYRDREHTSLES